MYKLYNSVVFVLLRAAVRKTKQIIEISYTPNPSQDIEEEINKHFPNINILYSHNINRDSSSELKVTATRCNYFQINFKKEVRAVVDMLCRWDS